MSLDAGPRPRPAHAPGTTRCTYTPNGEQLVSVGANNTIRLYKTGFDGEPRNVDESEDLNMAVVATDDVFIVGSESGNVTRYSLETLEYEDYLLRTTLPIHDMALSADGRWCAVASGERTVRLVSTEDNTRVRHLRAHNQPTKHLAFDPQGRSIVLACTDGVLYVYSLTDPAASAEPELIKKLDGLIGRLEPTADESAAIAWHPDGRTFAVPTPTRDIQVVSRNDWEKQRVFAGGHEGAITALAWSPNGALLASAGRDGKILLWETKTLSVVARHNYGGVQSIAWHPANNLVSFTNGEGEVYIYPDFVPAQFAVLLRLPVQPSPFIHDPNEGLASRLPIHAAGQKRDDGGEDEDEDDLDLGFDDDDDNNLDDEDGLDDFVVDDDGAGYTVPHGQKRPAADGLAGRAVVKRVMRQAPAVSSVCHAAFQPGSTPWRGNRRYLCLNLVGVVWTVDQDAHHTVTVEFYDRDFQRDFHFTDTFLYDKACLATHGTLFASAPRDGSPALLFYRPHESWTQQRLDWRTRLPAGETVVALSLSASFVTVVTSADYVRVYTLFGVPHRVYRPKSTPVVSCASWRDYVLTLGNGPLGSDGRTARLHYTLENVRRDVVCQNDDVVALPAGATVESVFFSDVGEPCIYDSTGTLLTLLHWRQPGRASWVPLLDTRRLARLASGRKHESYFPIAVAGRRFHCIILKGGDRYPYFPRPLLSEFDFSVPLGGAAAGGEGDDEDEDGMARDEESEEAQARKLEQALVLQNVHVAQLEDQVAGDDGGGEGDEEEADADADADPERDARALARLRLETDKTLLQLLALECRAGEERGMRGLELVRLMRDSNGQLLEAAVKVAERYGRTMLGSKIREEGERRLERRLR